MPKHAINILAFGQAAQFCGGPQLTIELDLPCTVGDLRLAIANKCPLMRTNYMIAIDQCYAADHVVIDDRGVCEIAIIPPVSGG